MSTELAQRPIRKEKEIEFFKPTLSREDLKGVLECLVEEQLATGQIADRFEKSFCHTFKSKYAISTNSLTAAYHLALMALGVKEGDPVLLSSFAPISALDAIFLVKAKPILLDLKRHSFHPDPDEFQKKKELFQVRFAILDHSFGSLLDFSAYPLDGMETIEDFTEGIGGSPETFSVGKQGKLAVCGFQAENMITTGNGAMIVTLDGGLTNHIRSLKAGSSTKRNLGEPKYDYNLVDYQAALGIEQLSKLGIILERKRKIALAYLQAVQNSRLETYFQNPLVDTFQRFPILVASQNFEEVERYFKSIHIGTQKTIEEPLHRVLEENPLSFPNAERLFQRGHCIPIYPNLTKDNVLRIATAIRRIY